MSELILPPHIELRQGLYFNTISGRWIGAYKIQKVCDDYWAESPDDIPVIEGAPGVLFYKKGMPVMELAKKHWQKLSMSNQLPSMILSWSFRQLSCIKSKSSQK